MKLLLFDIDGTLVNTGGAGLRAINRAFEEMYGHHQILEGISLAGRTDDMIMMDAYGKAGMDFFYNELLRFKSVYFNLVSEELKNGNTPMFLMPGVTELLLQLDSDDYFCLALLTGNWEQSGRIKIEYFGLNDYFPFGAFADDSPQRADLVPVAMQRFEKRYGVKPVPEDVYVFGDTPSDILCTKPHGVVSVAVAAASYSMEELNAYEPDILLNDLSNTAVILDILT